MLSCSSPRAGLAAYVNAQRVVRQRLRPARRRVRPAAVVAAVRPSRCSTARPCAPSSRRCGAASRAGARRPGPPARHDRRGPGRRLTTRPRGRVTPSGARAAAGGRRGPRPRRRRGAPRAGGTCRCRAPRRTPAPSAARTPAGESFRRPARLLGSASKPPAGERKAGRVRLAVLDVAGGDDEVDAVELEGQRLDQRPVHPVRSRRGDDRDRGAACGAGPPSISSRAPGTARAASSGTCESTSASTASGSSPSQGPFSVAKTSTARRPVKTERSGSSQPLCAKNDS